MVLPAVMSPRFSASSIIANLLPYTLHLTTYTLHPAPLPPTPLPPTPYTLRPSPVTLHPTPHNLGPRYHTPLPLTIRVRVWVTGGGLNEGGLAGRDVAALLRLVDHREPERCSVRE